MAAEHDLASLIGGVKRISGVLVHEVNEFTEVAVGAIKITEELVKEL